VRLTRWVLSPEDMRPSHGEIEAALARMNDARLKYEGYVQQCIDGYVDPKIAETLRRDLRDGTMDFLRLTG